MNRLVGMAVLGAMIAGCATTGGHNDPVGSWQKERFAGDAIKALQSQNKLPTAADVAVKSGMATKKFADMVEGFDVPFAETYVYWVRTVDKMYAQSEGRIVFQDVLDAMYDNKTSFEAEVAKLAADDKKLLDEYLAYAEKTKVDTGVLERAIADAEKAAAAAAQVLDLVNKIKASSEYAALTGLALVKENAAVACDSSNLKSQLSDIGTGTHLYKVLAEQDKKAKEYVIKR